MPHDPTAPPALDFALQVEALYAELVRSGSRTADAEPSLGGKLFYAGELDAYGRALLVAGNIAGVASLAATADMAAQKQAVRDGVADFLVTNLDEALRILKNEIRKCETVAVCVAQSPDEIEAEIGERGVRPDLRRLETALDPSEQGHAEQARLTWQVDESPARWLPKLDALAIGCLGHTEGASRRWLRLAPRYLGRLAQGIRLLRCEPEIAETIIRHVKERVTSREFNVTVQLDLNSGGASTKFRFEPART